MSILNRWKNISRQVSYDDPPAAIIAFGGDKTGVNTAVIASTTLTLTEGSTASAFDMSAAGYDTWGELQAGIAAIASGNWKLHLLGPKATDLIYSTNLGVNTFSSTTIPSSGQPITQAEATAVNSTYNLYFGIGPEADTGLSGWARTSANSFTEPYDPIYGTTWGKVKNGGPYVTRLKEAVVTLTFANAGTATVTIEEQDQSGNSNTLIPAQTIATATGFTFAPGIAPGTNQFPLPADGLVSKPGYRLVIRVAKTTAAITAGTVTFVDADYAPVS